MAKRDYISEITAKRKRLRGRGARAIQFDDRVDDMIQISRFLEATPKSEMPAKAELVKYLPIGWVACIEGYFRLVYRDLIDHGPPFRENSANLKDVRIDLDHVVAMQAGQVSLGEFIAHLLPVNGLDDINRAMSTLIGGDYYDQLKHVKTDLFEDNSSLEDLDLSGGIFESIEFLFAQRHLFAHELNAKLRVHLRDTFHHSRAASILIEHNEALLKVLGIEKGKGK